jgi:hypothetical protein
MRLLKRDEGGRKSGGERGEGRGERGEGRGERGAHTHKQITAVFLSKFISVQKSKPRRRDLKKLEKLNFQKKSGRTS